MGPHLGIVCYQVPLQSIIGKRLNWCANKSETRNDQVEKDSVPDQWRPHCPCSLCKTHATCYLASQSLSGTPAGMNVSCYNCLFIYLPSNDILKNPTGRSSARGSKNKEDLKWARSLYLFNSILVGEGEPAAHLFLECRVQCRAGLHGPGLMWRKGRKKTLVIISNKITD